MIPRSTLVPGLAALFTRLSGVPAHVVNDGDDGMNFTFPAGAPYPETGSTDEGQVKVDFSILSEIPIGLDELRTSYDPDAVIEGDTYEPDPEDPEARLGGVVYAVNGNREMVIEVTCDRYNQSQPAYETLSRIRDRLTLPSARTEARALGLAVQTTRKIQRIDWNADGRSVSRYSLEIVCNTMSNETDDPVTTIEDVDVDTSEITP